jgi:hypothetical protein
MEEYRMRAFEKRCAGQYLDLRERKEEVDGEICATASLRVGFKVLEVIKYGIQKLPCHQT